MSDTFDNDEMREILQDFLAEAEEMLEGLDTFFVQLEANPEDRTLLNEIFRTAHSIKGSAGFIGLTRIVDVAHHAENVLNQLRQGQMRADPAVIDIILESMDVLKLLVQEVKTGKAADVDIESLNMKLDLLLQWGEDIQTETERGQEVVPPVPVAAEGGEELQEFQSKMPKSLRNPRILWPQQFPPPHPPAGPRPFRPFRRKGATCRPLRAKGTRPSGWRLPVWTMS
ncbi:MAG: Hpt domain-containing protein [Leptospirales bacterium]